MIIAVTGHRPEDIKEREVDVRTKFRRTFQEVSPEIVVVGMAAGVDLWGGHEAVKLGITIIAARPWAGHEPRVEDTLLYSILLEGASEIVVVDESAEYPGPHVYHKRNEYMVDHATHVLAYWSGIESGGTYACLNYARKVKKPIRNIYDIPPF